MCLLYSGHTKKIRSLARLSAKMLTEAEEQRRLSSGPGDVSRCHDIRGGPRQQWGAGTGEASLYVQVFSS